MSRTDSTITDWRRDPWDEPDEIGPEEMEPLPPERKGGRRLGLAFLGILVVMCLLAGLAGRWAIQQVSPPGDPGDPVNFTVNPGDTIETVAARLQQEGIITNARMFGWYVQRKGGLALHPGYFALKPRDDLGNIVGTLRTSPEQTFTNVTFPEGYGVDRMGARLEKTAPRLTAANFVAAATGGQVRSELAPEVTNLEGLLFPDSYQVGGSEPEVELVSRMAQQMVRVAKSVGLMKPEVLTGRTPYDVLKVASMIEKEAKLDEDRAIIARVIYNRLFLGSPLEIDSTLYYKQDSEAPFSTLRALDTPYNTYLHLGLPPTPITNPGKKSIEAALNPAPNPDPASCPGGVPCFWLYYVIADKDGRHVFATNYEDHLKNVANARAAGLLG
ncbi:MAG TPA: endolytic transglycosylase MltG [Acidimicrobiales bacterium]